MTRAISVLACAVLLGCGASPPPAPAPLPDPAARAIEVEWKVVQGDGDLVNVSIVVDGKSFELGTLAAATEMERGTPHTCALRAAHPLLTELTCGDMTSMYAAELEGDELVIRYVEGGARRIVTRVPVIGDGLSVAPYRLPD